jgi:hypothetical protein
VLHTNESPERTHACPLFTVAIGAMQMTSEELYFRPPTSFLSRQLLSKKCDTDSEGKRIITHQGGMRNPRLKPYLLNTVACPPATHALPVCALSNLRSLWFQEASTAGSVQSSREKSSTTASKAKPQTSGSVCDTAVSVELDLSFAEMYLFGDIRHTPFRKDAPTRSLR